MVRGVAGSPFGSHTPISYAPCPPAARPDKESA